MSESRTIEVASDSKGVPCLICFGLDFYPVFGADGEQIMTIDCPHCHKPGFHKTVSDKVRR